MKKLFLKFSMIGALSAAMVPSLSIASPVFVQPYSKENATNNIPLAYTPHSEQKQTTYGYNNAPVYEFADNIDPWAGTSFGKITTEQDFYDNVTGRRYNQYEYLGLLAQRGDRTGLNALVQDLKVNGVFDQGKFETAVRAALTAKPTTAGGGTTGPTAPSKPVVKQVYRPNTQNIMPQRTHNAYDEDMEADDITKKVKPIFLR